MKKYLFASLALLLCACGNVVGQDSEPENSEENNGWVAMFNGENLEGWTPKVTGFEVGDNHANTFRVEDGVLKVCYDQYEGPFSNRFGHLFYESPYSNYVMRMEYRFVGNQYEGGPPWANRNSGIMIHGQSPETMKKDQHFPVSIEVQLLGGKGDGEVRPTCNLCTPGTNVVKDGKLFQPHCTKSNSQTYDGEGWVRCEIEVRGNGTIRHRIEGETVLVYSQPQLDPRDEKAKQLIPESGDVRLQGGTISLQAESHGCEFRNIFIRELVPADPAK